MLSPLPRRSHWRYCVAHPSSGVSLPRYGSRVGPRIGLFEACSAFTRVTACTLALSPYFVTRFTRRLQPLRYLHDCSGCFRLERSPGGIRTHWKAPPYHGARQERTIDNFPQSGPSRLVSPQPIVICVLSSHIRTGATGVFTMNKALIARAHALRFSTVTDRSIR